jgi:hypothetical protein
MLDELAGWELSPPVLLADSGYGEVGQFRWGLDARQVPYVVEVRADTSAYPEQVRPSVAPHKGRGRRPQPHYREAPSSLAQLALAAGQQPCVDLIWRRGSRGLQRGGHPTPTGTPGRRRAASALAAGRMAGREAKADQVLAGEPARDHPAGGTGAAGQAALASGAGSPRPPGRPTPTQTSPKAPRHHLVGTQVVSRHLEHADGHRMRSAGLSTSPSIEVEVAGARPVLRTSAHSGGSVLSTTRGSPVNLRIEPATPFLPSMRRWFTPPRSTWRSRTTAQVRGAVGVVLWCGARSRVA